MSGDHLFEESKHTSDPGKSSWATTAYLDRDGKFWFLSKYENHRLVDGDHFVTLVTALDEGGNVVAVLKDVTGLDPDPLDIPNKKQATQEGYLPAELVQKVRKIVIEHSMWDKVNDKEFWKKVAQISSQVAGWLANRDGNGLKIP
ncbi:hypothetical protein [Methylobacterium oryzae]|uniref:hypothetical protein n=1 Tax=Methylobacterium oryzae TaxID=334852 RepID=UPI001F280C20|nr:hypothetical protein [Methylobacterium oryzae]UIN38352.1 hypothetical protein LXM90_30690 [Methylobacterium oryzae]